MKENTDECTLPGWLEESRELIDFLDGALCHTGGVVPKDWRLHLEVSLDTDGKVSAQETGITLTVFVY